MRPKEYSFTVQCPNTDCPNHLKYVVIMSRASAKDIYLCAKCDARLDIEERWKS